MPTSPTQPGTAQPTDPMTAGGALMPTAGRDRIVAIDVLRGVVLLGILVMNVSFMGWPEAWALDPLVFRDDTAGERGLWFLAEVFANMKMMSIFSLLFGAGIVLVADRTAEGGKSPAALHYKRMAWLLVFGLCHLFLFWHGDILAIYALVGSVVFLLRRLPVRWLVVVGLGFIGIAFVIWLGLGAVVALLEQHDPAAAAEINTYDAAGIAVEIENYRGGPLSQMHSRLPAGVFMLVFLGPVLYYWWPAGMMLLGMAAMKSRLITGQRTAGVYAGMLAVGLALGVPSAGALAWLRLENTVPAPSMVFFLMVAHFVTTLLMIPGWVGGVLLLCKQPWFRKPAYPLACVGRMALTNYLAQTVVVTFIFYGHGLGYFAKLERPAMFAIVLGVWALQLVWSPLWLARFRFGPMEWVWRSLTYLRPQPLLRRAATDAAP